MTGEKEGPRNWIADSALPYWDRESRLESDSTLPWLVLVISGYSSS